MGSRFANELLQRTGFGALVDKPSEDPVMPTWGERLGQAVKEAAVQTGATVAPAAAAAVMNSPGYAEAADAQIQKNIKDSLVEPLFDPVRKEIERGSPQDVAPLKREFRNELYRRGTHPNRYQVTEAAGPEGAMFLPKIQADIIRDTDRPGAQNWASIFEQLTKGKDGVRRNTVQAPNHPSIMAHEMGHALDYATEAGRQRLQSYTHPTGPNSQEAYLKRGKTRIAGSALANIDVGVDNTNPIPSIIGGSAAALADPHALKQMSSEVLANVKGAKLLKQAGGKFDWPKMLGANASYGLNHLARGAREGFTGWLSSVAVENGLKGLRDAVDPIIDNFTGPSPEEKALEKYGYDRDKHRITAEMGGEDGNVWKIDSRFGKRPSK